MSALFVCPSCKTMLRLPAKAFPVNCHCGAIVEGPVRGKIPARTPNYAKPTGGPGTELTALLKGLGLTERAGCGCASTARWMDEIGVAGCNLHFEEIVDKLKANAKKLGWREKLAIAIKLGASWVTEALCKQPWFDPFEPEKSMLDEAIRRAAEK